MHFRFNFSFKTKDFSLFDKLETEMLMITLLEMTTHFYITSTTYFEFREEWTILTPVLFQRWPLMYVSSTKVFGSKKAQKRTRWELGGTYTLCLLKKTNQSASDLSVILCKCQIYLPVSAYQILRKGGGG